MFSTESRSIGDLVQVNDLCANPTLRGALGTVVETGLTEKWHSWSLIKVLVNGKLLQFRSDTPQLEVVS